MMSSFISFFRLEFNAPKALMLCGMFLILSHFSLHAQQSSFKFTHYGKQDGLNQSSVNFIFQDSNDFLWIANFGGVNRFDGYDFVSYANDFNDNTSISDNSVWTIYERKDKSLWFGTKAGLSRYNTFQNSFENYVIRSDDETKSSLAVKAIYEDRNTNFFVGSEGEGLFLFDVETSQFTRVDGIPSNAKVTSIVEDTIGNLWVGTENLGLFKLSLDRNLNESFLTQNRFKSQIIWSLFSDKKGNVFIGTDQDGLVKYTKQDDAFVFLNTIDNNNYNSGTKIKTIAPDGDQGIWVGSATKGLSNYAFESQKFYTYMANPYDVNSLHDSDVSSIYNGRNNVLYVGFYTKGFDKIIKTPFMTLKHNPDNKNSLSSDNVYCSYKDKNDILWFGTFGGGLNRYNPKDQTFMHYRHDPNDNTSISHDWVRIIYVDKNDVMWIGTWGGGLNKFDRNTGKFKRYLPDSSSPNSLNLNIVTALFEDADDQLWIGTYGGGINIYRPETDDFKSITHSKINNNSISDDHITSFYQDETGLIWICTYGGGLNSYDKLLDRYRRYLPEKGNQYSLNNNKTLHIYKDKDSSFFWVTTLGGGLNKFYYKENKFISYTEKDGLSNNSTMGMLRDANNTYWISSNTGISHFDPQKNTFINYTTSDGLGSDDYNLEAYSQTRDSIMYFGGKNGITLFNPKDILGDDIFPKVSFMKIKLEDSIFSTAQSDEIEVPYKSRITFDYAALNADKPKKIKYAYQLLGQSDLWRNTANIRHLEFTDLDPGNYVLNIKSTNGNGVWNNTYVSQQLNIPAPWYMTWLFRIGLFLLIVSSAIIYYRVQINKAKARNRLLELKVKQRTKTIAESKSRIEKQSEVIALQNMDLQDLNVLKDKILSIISHDIKTPLTNLDYVVNVFDIDELISDKEALQSYMDTIQGDLGKVRSLLDNVLIWAKYQITNVDINIEAVNLDEILQEIYDLYAKNAQEKGVTMRHELTDVMVRGDKNIISFILRNLHANALKFTSNGGQITVTKTVNDGFVTLSVTDTGVGMSPEKVNQLFNDTTISWEKGTSGEVGTGLGLILCKDFAENHQGNMYVKSILGKGSTFSFKFPLVNP